MGLPIPFVVGGLLLLLNDQLRETLPRPTPPAPFLPFLLLLLLPWLVVRLATNVVMRHDIGSRMGRGLTLALHALPWSVPAAYAVMVLVGDLSLVAAAWAGESLLLFLAAAVLPLLALEVSYRLGEKRLAAVAARRGLALPAAPGQLALVWLVLVPLALLATLADVAHGHRWLHVFLTSTALGHLCGFLVTVLVLSVALPLLFCWLLPTSRRLPPAVAADIHATARTLGFSSRAVLTLRTDLRVANAAMVGPLPWPRYLVLTDALMAMLDPLALRGVVAHEVGHARAEHPGLLVLAFAVVPLLSFHALWLWLHDASTLTTSLTLGSLLLVALACLRYLAHRFEYEADQLSAWALGGSQPCIEALRRVGQLSARGTERGTLRHPADSRRIARLQRWELDRRERVRFMRSGRRVRVLIAAVTGIAAATCAWAQVQVWPVDRAVLAYYTGAFPEAGRRLASLPEWLPATLADEVHDLQREVDAALALVPAGGTWETVRDRLAEGGIERGIALLAQNDPTAALPWLSLSLSGRDPEPCRQTLYLLARAAADGDAPRLDRLRAHLASLAPPPDAWRAVADLAVTPPPAGGR